MSTKYRWLVWATAAVVTVVFGFLRGWDTLHKIFLIIIIVVGMLNLIMPVFQRRMLQKIKAMPSEEREKFISKFDQRTQAKLRKQLNDDGKGV